MSVHGVTLGDVLGEHRRGRPHGLAVVDADVRLTYPQLDERVNRLAAALAADGVAPGERVLWLGRNSFRILELLLACARLGAICCPANWRQSADELTFVLDDLRPAIVVFEESEAAAQARSRTETAGQARTRTEAAGQAGARTGAGARWIAAGEEYEAYLAAGAPAEPAVEVTPDRPVLALYTAAFDGRPAAALLSHSALIAHSMAILHIRQMEDGFTYLDCGPLFHVGTMMFCLATFQLGGTNVFTPAYDAKEVCPADRGRAVHAGVPVRTDDRPARRGELRRHVRPVVAALRLPLPRVGRHDHRRRQSLVRVEDGRLWADRGRRHAHLPGAGPRRAGVRRPSPLAHVRILDPAGDEVPPGETGEICARGAGVFSGYWNRPELNAAKTAGGWHHTGDLGRREPDGTLTFIGPRLRMIKSANENIYPAEVERALKSHEAVTDAAVIGVPDPEWGQNVKAIIVRKEGASLTPEEVVEHVRNQIASYKKPRHIEFAEFIPKKGYTPDYDALDAAYGGGGYPGM
ncbi:AMP-binding protein [Actinoallomurus acanthiterrae]